MKTEAIKKGCDTLDRIRVAKKFVTQNDWSSGDFSYYLRALDSTSAEEVKQAILEVLGKREQSVTREIKEKVNL